MRLGNNTVLITGGGSGIGYALAERFLAAGSRVAICGRRSEVLERARTAHPELATHVCDVTRTEERVELATWAMRELPALNVLVNNAGVQRRVALAEAEEWETTHAEITANFEAPVHLTRLLLPHLMARQEGGAIVNVTSGLAFVPLARVPIYCATKAAMHSFTLSLRRQLVESGVEVVEIIPPAVDTDLGGVGLHTFGSPLAEFADEVAARLNAGETEIAYGFARDWSEMAQKEYRAAFDRMNAAR